MVEMGVITRDYLELHKDVAARRRDYVNHPLGW